MLDRIDLHVHVSAVEISKLSMDSSNNEKSKTIQQRVQVARNIQEDRFTKSNITCNAEMSSRFTKRFCHLNKNELDFLTQATVKLGLTARSYFKTIKVARTITDLANSDDIEIVHLAESLQYRHSPHHQL